MEKPLFPAAISAHIQLASCFIDSTDFILAQLIQFKFAADTAPTGSARARTLPLSHPADNVCHRMRRRTGCDRGLSSVDVGKEQFQIAEYRRGIDIPCDAGNLSIGPQP